MSVRTHTLPRGRGPSANEAKYSGMFLPCREVRVCDSHVGQDHKSRFYFPQRPAVGEKCRDLVYRLIQDKESRLCSKRYQMKDRGQLDSGRNTDFFSRYVFADDAEDIKSHRWFKNVPWDQLQHLSPPFVPRIEAIDDTHYFDESEPIEDWSESSPSAGGLSPDDIKTILCDFREGVQIMAMQLVATPYDSAKLKTIDQQIDAIASLAGEEKEVLKHFVRLYGRKERKRPRDRLLRDEGTRNIVMDVRKKTAFLGYTWRRMRPEGYAHTA